MTKYLAPGPLTALFQTLLGLGVAIFPGVFSPSVQSEATTVVAGMIGSVFGVVHLVQHIRSGSK